MLTRMDDIEEIPVSEMGEKYGSLRIVNPRADEAMLQSMKRYGQLTPVVCAKREGYELIDGFKRLRACQRIGKEALKAKVLEASERACKAAIIQLNRLRPIRELEEALVLSSLHREDGLTQTEIAVLLGRHKSWVSRRIALIERLCEEVLDDIRLGLLSATAGRELAKLPRGNQPEIAAALVKHRLSTREAAELVPISSPGRGGSRTASSRAPGKSWGRPSRCRASRNSSAPWSGSGGRWPREW